MAKKDDKELTSHGQNGNGSKPMGLLPKEIGKKKPQPQQALLT